MEQYKLQPFAFDIYTQLSQLQRDIGSLAAAQQAMADQIRQSEAHHNERLRDESRVIHALNQFETRIPARVDKVEADLSGRIQSTENNLSVLRDRVNRVFWTTAGGGIIFGLALDWKPIFSKAASFLAS